MTITEKECTGCSSCVNKCPLQCISLVKNKEGFFYPQIDTQKCTKCNLCISACPLNKNQKFENDSSKAYLAYSFEKADRILATSGGLFGKLACNVIDNGGIVYGAAFGNDHTVQFIGAQNHEQLKRLFKSKYVQADVGNIYNDVKKMLK